MKNYSPDAPEVKLIENFHLKKVRHLRVQEQFDALKKLTWASCNESIIAVIGATGVGKSALLRQFVATFNAAHESAMERNPAMLPAVYLELPSPISGDVNWKDVFVRLLGEMDEPLVDRKVVPHLPSDSPLKTIKYPIRGVAEELRRSLLSCVRHRDTKVIVLDEGRNLFYSRSSMRHSLQLNLVKSLSNDIKIPIVIGSSYDFLNTNNFHAQLARRTRILHFERYSEADFANGNPYGISFRDTLYSLLHALPVQWDRGLLKHSAYFMMHSVGCIGILKDWLKRTLTDALDLNQPIDSYLIEKNKFENKVLQQVLNESLAGEQLLTDISDDEFARNFSFSQPPSLTSVTRHKPPVSENGPRRSRRKPGVRGPSRDKVGVEL